jgi:hypothetical protein
MAYLVTVNILIDESDASRVVDGINDMLKEAQEPVEDGGESWIVDWSFDSVDLGAEELNDTICNETYSEGDAFRDWVIFSRSESIVQDGGGFWSNEYGWTTLDLATRFDPISHNLPHSKGMDAVMMIAPYNMNYYRIKVMEVLDDAGSVDVASTTWFECWANLYEDAMEKARHQYPGNYSFVEEEKNDFSPD